MAFNLDEWSNEYQLNEDTLKIMADKGFNFLTIRKLTFDIPLGDSNGVPSEDVIPSTSRMDPVNIHQLARDKDLNELLASLKAPVHPGDELWSSSDEGSRELLDERRTTDKPLLIPDCVSKVG